MNGLRESVHSFTDNIQARNLRFTLCICTTFSRKQQAWNGPDCPAQKPFRCEHVDVSLSRCMDHDGAFEGAWQTWNSTNVSGVMIYT